MDERTIQMKAPEMDPVKLERVRDILTQDKRVVFAYLYGSSTEHFQYRDIDIAVYATPGCNPFHFATDLKIALHEQTGIPPDVFDIRVINGLIEHGNLFALLYLHHIFERNILLVDKDRNMRTAFIEQYNLKYRECEGLLDEVLV
jgi:predicted nucleotidyltransferase